MAKKMKAAGIRSASVSIDGLKEVHDHLRDKQGSWQAAFEAMQHF
jgi:MoaA/NifB/PqqE/SkfB family radical SAM enzyme